MKRKGVACIVLVVLLLFACALPCFAGENTIQKGQYYGVAGLVEQKVRFHVPIINYHPNNGVTVVGWEVHEMDFSNKASVAEQILDLEVNISVSIVTNATSYRADTRISVNWDIRGDDYYAHTESIDLPTIRSPQEVITGYKLGENRPVNTIEVMSESMHTDMTNYVYKLAVIPYVLDNSKAYTIDIYLVNPEFRYAINQQTQTDKEIIDDLHGSLDDNDIDYIETSGYKSVMTMLFDMWYMESICLIVISVATVGFVLYGKR